MALRLTIYRGTHTIGGNCVELSTDSTRIVIDVGMPLVDENGESFDAQSLTGKSTQQLLADGTLPPVPGLFDGDSPPDAILLSHAHCDHTGLIKHTNKAIPVYLSHGTSDMMYVGLKFARQAGVGHARQQKFKAGEAFQIGDFTVTAYAVDHSAFDSMAFIIEAEGKRILYSGDLRLHGRKPGMARDLIAAAKKKPIDVMLMEGTHVGANRKPTVTEKGLEETTVRIIQQTKGIVLACFSPLHVDRLVTFYKATLQAGRTFVVDPYAALVMNKAAQYCNIPDPAQEKTIRVFYNRDFEEGYAKKKLVYVHKMFLPNRITMDAIRSSPEKVLMIFRPRMLDADFGSQFPRNACVIYSYWAGYLEKPPWPAVQEKLQLAEGRFEKVHTSGHILPDDLRTFVQEVNPKVLLPIHTFEPAGFKAIHPDVKVLEDGVVFEVVP